MRPAIATAARSLAALFLLAPAFAACQGPSEDENNGSPVAQNDQLSEAERERAAKEGDCAPDETPEKVCKDLPDGNVECVVICVPQQPQFPGCDAGTHPVKACKPSDGPDNECFILCLPDDQPPPVDPDECGPGTHPEWICEGPVPLPTPVPMPQPFPNPYPGDPDHPSDPNGPIDLPTTDPNTGSGGGSTPGFPGGGGPGYPGDPDGGQCKIVCMPDLPPFPQCPPGTHPEKICRFDPTTGQEFCSVECLPDGGEPPPNPTCPDGTFPEVVCKDVGNGEVVCELVCTPKDPNDPPYPGPGPDPIPPQPPQPDKP
jgi:hypothetical protein